MEKTMTRKEYMENSPDLHHKYYLQFAKPSAYSLVLRTIGKEAILASKDKHLNDIPLNKWDSLSGFVFRGSEMVVKPRYIPDFIDGKKLKEAEEGYSCSTGVCILKAVAKEIKNNQ
jgi:hypothetical protein